jgi:hypothetical protein
MKVLGLEKVTLSRRRRIIGRFHGIGRHSGVLILS